MSHNLSNLCHQLGNKKRQETVRSDKATYWSYVTLCTAAGEFCSEQASNTVAPLELFPCLCSYRCTQEQKDFRSPRKQALLKLVGSLLQTSGVMVLRNHAPSPIPVSDWTGWNAEFCETFASQSVVSFVQEHLSDTFKLSFLRFTPDIQNNTLCRQEASKPSKLWFWFWSQWYELIEQSQTQE